METALPVQANSHSLTSRDAIAIEALSMINMGGDSKPPSNNNSSEEKEVIAREHECHECGDRFESTSELRRHEKISHDKKTYKCRKCGQLFLSIADRQTHKNNKHFSTIQCEIKNSNFKEFEIGTVVKSNRNQNGYFECPVEYCSFVTRIPGYWYDHIHHVIHEGYNPQQRKRNDTK